MSTRKIIHVDMDCFYAAVEMRDDPSLKGSPLAIGGSPEDRGVIATANYPAREYGIHSAMPSHKAVDACPDLTLLSPDFEKYRTESKYIRNIFRSYTTQIEPLSLDEAYLDVTKSSKMNGSATKIASAIREQIRNERNLTASAGVAPNKFLAKVASDWNKPDGQKTIPPDQVDDFVQALPVEEIPGVGDVSQNKLHERNIETCGDLQEYSRAELRDTFGKWGIKLYHLSRGKDDRSVSTDRERKSLSVERTFSNDLSRLEEIRSVLESLYDSFQERWYETDLPPSRVDGLFVKVKFADFQQKTRQRTYHRLPDVRAYESLIQDVFETDPRPIRLIGIGVMLCSRKEGRFRNAQKPLFPGT